MSLTQILALEDTVSPNRITRMDKSSDNEEKVGRHISLNAYTSEEFGQKQRDDPEICKFLGRYSKTLQQIERKYLPSH